MKIVIYVPDTIDPATAVKLATEAFDGVKDIDVRVEPTDQEKMKMAVLAIEKTCNEYDPPTRIAAVKLYRKMVQEKIGALPSLADSLRQIDRIWSPAHPNVPRAAEPLTDKERAAGELARQEFPNEGRASVTLQAIRRVRYDLQCSLLRAKEIVLMIDKETL